MISVGLTGGIGSGKSVVSQMFNLLYVPVYNSDYEAKNIMQTNPEVKAEIIKVFGKIAYRNNMLNKEYIASEIFSNNELKTKIDNIVHKSVIQNYNLWKKKQINTKFVLIESAILFETKLASKNKFNILVISTKELKHKHLIERGLTLKEIEQRIQSQFSDKKKIKLADFVIVNNEKRFVSKQVLSILKKINRSIKLLI